MTDAPHPDQWLAAQLAKLNQSLDDVLDIDAGLCDAQLPGQRDKLNQALDEVLDTETGLNAIQPSTAQPAPADTHEQIALENANTPALALTAYAHQLMASPWHIRLTTRARVPHRELALVNSTALCYPRASARRRNLDLALDQARDLTRDLADAGDRDRAHELARALAIALDLTGALARAHAIDHVLARALATALDLTGALARDLTLDHVLDLAHAMNQAIDHAHDLALALDHDYKLNLEATLIRARAAADELDRTHDVAMALDRTLGYGREHGFDEPFAVALVEALDQLKEATTDFTGADLAAVDLEGIPLQGLHWSSTTQWPPGWEEPIRQASVRLEPDLYEIHDDPRIHSDLTQ